MISRIRTSSGRTFEERRRFFDTMAADYADRHGDAKALLEYRVRLLRQMLPELDGTTVMELGCGPADHLLALVADGSARGVAVDFSTAMIDVVRKRVAARSIASSVEAVVDSAETLSRFPDSSIDSVCSVGAIEHIPRKSDVFASVARVLRPGGVFACLTMNGEYLWHTVFGRIPGVRTRHISSDSFLSADEVRKLSHASRLGIERIGYWTFVPAGDMNAPVAGLFRALDAAGRTLFAAWLRGGLLFALRKPHAD